MGANGASVLVVDDEQLILGLLRALFLMEGWNCHCASDSASALGLLETTPVSVAFVDIHLGQEDGIDLIRTIRERWPNISVVAMTGSSVRCDDGKIGWGAQRLLLKPLIELDDLVGIVREVAEVAV